MIYTFLKSTNNEHPQVFVSQISAKKCKKQCQFEICKIKKNVKIISLVTFVSRDSYICHSLHHEHTFSIKIISNNVHTEKNKWIFFKK